MGSLLDRLGVDNTPWCLDAEGPRLSRSGVLPMPCVARGEATGPCGCACAHHGVPYGLRSACVHLPAGWRMRRDPHLLVLRPYLNESAGTRTGSFSCPAAWPTPACR